MRIACWVHKGYKYTLRIRNTAVPLQQCSHERASLLRDMYLTCLDERYQRDATIMIYYHK